MLSSLSFLALTTTTTISAHGFHTPDMDGTDLGANDSISLCGMHVPDLELCTCVRDHFKAYSTQCALPTNSPPTTDNKTSGELLTSAGPSDIIDPTGADSDGTVEGYKIKSLPTGGTLTLADGSAVAVDDILSVTEANGLLFDPDGSTDAGQTFRIAAIDNDDAEDASYGTITIPLLLDTDGDGTPDVDDAFPNDANESTDTDGDGTGNNADPDVDDAFP